MLKDVLITMGIVTDHRAIGQGLGSEYSGIITKVGSNVSSLKVGDRVLGCRTGSFVTKIVLDKALCVKIPEDFAITSSEAASMPVVCCTAMYALENLARLNSEKVGPHCTRLCDFLNNLRRKY